MAKGQLHIASILARLSRHDEAIRCLAQVLVLVDDGRLEVGGSAPQKLCLVAVAYVEGRRRCCCCCCCY